MIKFILFDVDGVIIQREMYFTERFVKDFGVPFEKILPFFQNEFRLCVTGKADLKQELQKYLPLWNWNKPVEDLLNYWFSFESKTDPKILQDVKHLRASGIQCYLSANNEKYRVEYLRDVVGLGNFFDGIFSSAALGFSKSENPFWAAAHKALGAPAPTEVLVWDDDEEIVETAKKFGFNAELYKTFDAYKAKMNTILERA